MRQHRKFSEIQDPVEQELYLEKLIKKHHDDELREQWGKLVKKKPDEPRKSKFYPFAKLSIAASLLILLALCAYLYTSSSAKEPIYYAMEELRTPITHPGIIKGVQEDDQNRTQAILDFNKGEYESAIASFSQIDITSEEDEFYEAMAHIYSKDYTIAIKKLTPISKGQTEIAQEARWFLSQAYIMTNNSSSAKETLESIEPGDWNYEKARDLIQQLN